jgi:hypothetical protein
MVGFALSHNPTATQPANAPDTSQDALLVVENCLSKISASAA